MLLIHGWFCRLATSAVTTTTITVCCYTFKHGQRRNIIQLFSKQHQRWTGDVLYPPLRQEIVVPIGRKGIIICNQNPTALGSQDGPFGIWQLDEKFQRRFKGIVTNEVNTFQGVQWMVDAIWCWLVHECLGSEDENWRIWEGILNLKSSRSQPRCWSSWKIHQHRNSLRPPSSRTSPQQTDISWLNWLERFRKQWTLDSRTVQMSSYKQGTMMYNGSLSPWIFMNFRPCSWSY